MQMDVYLCQMQQILKQEKSKFRLNKNLKLIYIAP